MARRQPAYRRKRKNLFSVILGTMAVIIVLIVAGISGIGLRERRDMYAARERALEAQIAAEEQRTLDIEEFKRYTKSHAYKEEMARDKLGMVYEGEIIFQEKK